MTQLHAYVPYPIAALLIAHPDHNPVDDEQRFEAATLFADISGFTQLSESLANHGRVGTEELTVLLNSYFDMVISLIRSYGGMVGTFGGDSLTVLFPADSANPIHAVRRAVQCALAMQAAMDRYQELPTSAGTFQLAMKAGLAYGEVLCVTVGDPATRLAYLIAGTALERCADAEHLALQGEIVLHASLSTRAGPLRAHRRHEDFIWLLGIDPPEPAVSLPDLIDPDPRAMAMLRAYLHAAVVRRLETGNTGFVNEHRSVTMLFVRFQSFDYDHDPAVRDKLQAYLGEVIQIVQAYGGYLQQIDVGDKGSKYIVLFGSPVAFENDLERALYCALDLRRASAAAGIPTATGINSGSVYCGLVGASVRQEYTVIGDAVNLAARLMQAAEDGRILVSRATAHAARPVFSWQDVPAVTVKGRADPIPVIALTGLIPQQAIRLQEADYTLPLVGRETELALVERIMARVGQHHGQIVGLTAEAGLGKSRLVAEILRMAEAAGLTSYGGACQSHATQTSYLVWQAIWRAFFALEAEWPPDVQRRVLEMQLTLINPLLVVRGPLLGRVFNQAWPDNDVTRAMDGQVRKTLCEQLLVDCLRARSSTTPLMIILEDCHWIDPLSKDLLETLGRVIGDLPVLLVVVFRPLDHEQQPPFGMSALPYYTQIRLTDFTVAEAEQLIANKLAQFAGMPASLPADVIARLTARAQGNPFYLEELLNYIHDRSPDQPVLLDQLELPASLHSLILSRIDQLAERQQLTLKVASILGRMFNATQLWSFYPQLGGPAQVSHDLESLSQFDLTQLDTPAPEAIYLFKHIMTHEVAYESLAYSTRTQLHERFAQFLEASSPDPDQHVDLLAYHYGRSQNTAKQCEYLWRAATRAQAVYANGAAITYYQSLLPLVSADAQIAVLLNLGQILELVGEWDAADEIYQQVDERTRGEETSRPYAQCQYARGGLLGKRGEYAQAHAALAQAQAVFTALDDRAGLSQTFAEIGQVYRRQGNYPAARACFEASLEQQRQAGDRPGIAGALGNLGITAYAQGDYQTATAYHQASLELRRELGDKLGIATALNGLGIVAYAQSDYQAAETYFSASLELRRGIGDKLGITNCLNNLGVVAYEQGNDQAASTLYQESLELRREIGAKGGIATSLNNLGYVLLRQGQVRQAAALLRESLAIHYELGNQQGLAESLTGLASVLVVEDASTSTLMQAAQLCATIQRLLETTNSVLEPTERTVYDQALAAATRGLAGPLFESAWQEGERMPLEAVMSMSVATSATDEPLAKRP
jgi:adenylate cyclase